MPLRQPYAVYEGWDSSTEETRRTFLFCLANPLLRLALSCATCVFLRLGDFLFQTRNIVTSRLRHLLSNSIHSSLVGLWPVLPRDTLYHFVSRYCTRCFLGPSLILRFFFDVVSHLVVPASILSHTLPYARPGLSYTTASPTSHPPPFFHMYLPVSVLLCGCRCLLCIFPFYSHCITPTLIHATLPDRCPPSLCSPSSSPFCTFISLPSPTAATDRQQRIRASPTPAPAPACPFRHRTEMETAEQTETDGTRDGKGWDRGP
ncbi:hypothetical protein B0H13DRAFT_839163 [Mycena leptocephala]|nr:hypothetical protein B0H13DRAFT_839163 [Mycena leptocephala]